MGQSKVSFWSKSGRASRSSRPGWDDMIIKLLYFNVHLILASINDSTYIYITIYNAVLPAPPTRPGIIPLWAVGGWWGGGGPSAQCKS